MLFDMCRETLIQRTMVFSESAPGRVTRIGDCGSELSMRKCKEYAIERVWVCRPVSGSLVR